MGTCVVHATVGITAIGGPNRHARSLSTKTVQVCDTAAWPHLSQQLLADQLASTHAKPLCICSTHITQPAHSTHVHDQNTNITYTLQPVLVSPSYTACVSVVGRLRAPSDFGHTFAVAQHHTTVVPCWRCMRAHARPGLKPTAQNPKHMQDTAQHACNTTHQPHC
jgi:hypothetical protein